MLERTLPTLAGLAFTLGLGAATASADPMPADGLAAALAPASPTTSIGVRIGGYGFRRDGDTIWNECRMNGLGLFGDHAIGGPLFVEASLDFYFSQDFPLPSPSTDTSIDRMSVLPSVAIGVQSFVAPWLRTYAQAGGGVELTRVSTPYGDSGATIHAERALPFGFAGAGLDVRVGRATYLGANLRMLVMGNFDYDTSKLQMSTWVEPPTPSQVFAASPDLALQAQFYVRRAL